ncbi:hypothetical protein Tco_1202473 [Tanacetum coccineum]
MLEILTSEGVNQTNAFYVGSGGPNLTELTGWRSPDLNPCCPYNKLVQKSFARLVFADVARDARKKEQRKPNDVEGFKDMSCPLNAYG